MLSRKSLIVALLAPVLFFTGNGTSWATPTATVVKARTSVVDCIDYKVKPISLTFSCADGGIILSAAKWSKWTSTSAIGSGKLVTNLCKPTCAAGKFKTEAVKISLSKVKISKTGKKVFSLAKLTITGKKAKGKKALFYTLAINPFN